ncbi:MAG: flagellar hook protein FlgE [Magnetococcales bacterium]|nr:flagellar hook protein FlgE [Magnetococcales bacterium]
MSIMQAMQAGSSALSHFGDAMTVVGNNLANANTTAFKGSRTTFEDVLIQTVGTSGTRASTQIGTGVTLSSVDQDLNQGSFNSTVNVTDLAIDGKGFFQVRDKENFKGNGADDDMYYTRAGNFKQDKNGDLVISGGLILQGNALKSDGSLESAKVVDVNLGQLKYQQIDPQATGLVDIGILLSSEDPVITDPLHDTYDANDSSSYNFVTTIRVYDNFGTGHNIQLQFKKLAPDTAANPPIGNNTWEWHVVVPTDELDPEHQGTGLFTAVDQTPGNVQTAPTAGDGAAGYTVGRLEFDGSGRLVTEGSTPIEFNFKANATGNKPDAQEVLFNFGDAIGALGDSTNDFHKTATQLAYDASKASVAEEALTNTGRDGSVQVAGNSTTLKLTQDGFPPGSLDSLSVNQDGKVIGIYTNGQSRPLYQVLLVDFDNEAALEQVGANLFSETFQSGVPRAGAPQTGRRGSVLSFTLEQSNVDMSAEFVRMITMQRGFQANSRIVTVTDGMLEELISLKR